MNPITDPQEVKGKVFQMKRKRPARMTIRAYIKKKYSKSKVKFFFSCKLPSLIRRKLGFWYCGYCNKYHSALVIRYDYSDGLANDFCSIGKDAILDSEWMP